MPIPRYLGPPVAYNPAADVVPRPRRPRRPQWRQCGNCKQWFPAEKKRCWHCAAQVVKPFGMPDGNGIFNENGGGYLESGVGPGVVPVPPTPVQYTLPANMEPGVIYPPMPQPPDGLPYYREPGPMPKHIPPFTDIPLPDGGGVRNPGPPVVKPKEEEGPGDESGAEGGLSPLLVIAAIGGVLLLVGLSGGK